MIQEQIEKMTLDEKIGQMVLVGFNGDQINDSIKKMIDSYHIGGFILFQRNIKNPSQTLALLNTIKSANSKNKIPLFLAVDEEGGKVSRMPKEIKKLPTNKKIGILNNNHFSFEIGQLIGFELKSFGFNLDFAPVLDINSNPKNPVIGDRSFGSNKEIVSQLGLQTMKGIKSQNIISVVKHFPGHGDTSVDSHLGLPVVNHDLNRLKSFELAPFSKAIKENVDAVMVSHILFPKIDSQYPATLSKKIMTDLLRNNLNFKGVIITDDMEMGAILKHYDIGNAAIRSIQSGSDIILICHTYEKQLTVLDALKKAVENNEISEEQINDSVYRILKLKKKYHIKDTSIKSIDVKDINNQIDYILNTYLGG
ncbi:beta-N-acetylhexosaminidase [Crassaminicella profunda]|uniref:beta-N-acetylhexosaminidase n=1 Tax=Crassaminicella profunda TaxID=1286698 RepID=UPI001FEC407F|nr:beta-N-acetylhexosaminidase [Crassaminicella profunda]